MNKYNAKKTEIDGHVFDSKTEAEYYVHLLELVRHGEIRDLQLQPKFGFIIHGEPLKSHKNRAITYSANSGRNAVSGRPPTGRQSLSTSREWRQMFGVSNGRWLRHCTRR